MSCRKSNLNFVFENFCCSGLKIFHPLELGNGLRNYLGNIFEYGNSWGPWDVQTVFGNGRVRLSSRKIEVYGLLVELSDQIRWKIWGWFEFEIKNREKCLDVSYQGIVVILESFCLYEVFEFCCQELWKLFAEKSLRLWSLKYWGLIPSLVNLTCHRFRQLMGTIFWSWKLCKNLKFAETFCQKVKQENVCILVTSPCSHPSIQALTYSSFFHACQFTSRRFSSRHPPNDNNKF
jgi:hypothetical protein